jgi:hypothetical protein
MGEKIMRTVRNMTLMSFVLSMIFVSSTHAQNVLKHQKGASSKNVRVLWQFDSGG